MGMLAGTLPPMEYQAVARIMRECQVILQDRGLFALHLSVSASICWPLVYCLYLNLVVVCVLYFASLHGCAGHFMAVLQPKSIRHRGRCPVSYASTHAPRLLPPSMTTLISMTT